MTSHTIIFGSPDSGFTPAQIQQQGSDTCAIKSQELILHNFGIHTTENQLVQEAEENGWYNGGTAMGDMGNLLELHGISTQTFEHANQYTLLHELSQGHQVMVAVDSGELWSNSIWEKFEDQVGVLPGSGADHAIVITGIDASVPNDVQVIITDPGSGQCVSYPWAQFADAWQDSDFYMVSTTTAPDMPQTQGLSEQLAESLLSLDIMESIGITDSELIHDLFPAGAPEIYGGEPHADSIDLPDPASDNDFDVASHDVC